MALLPFRLILHTGAGSEGPVGRGKQSHPEVFLSLCWCSPAAFLPPHLASWQAVPASSRASLDPGALAIPGYHQGTNTSQAISWHFCLFLSALSTLSSFPMLPPCLHPISCQPHHSREPGCLSSSPSLRASILSVLSTPSALGLG